MVADLLLSLGSGQDRQLFSGVPAELLWVLPQIIAANSSQDAVVLILEPQYIGRVERCAICRPVSRRKAAGVRSPIAKTPALVFVSAPSAGAERVDTLGGWSHRAVFVAPVG